MIKIFRFPLRNIDSAPVHPIEMFEMLLTKWAKANGEEQNQKLIYCTQSGLQSNKFLTLTWFGYCRIALLLVFGDIFNRVVSNDLEAAKNFNADNATGCGGSDCTIRALRVIGQTQS